MAVAVPSLKEEWEEWKTEMEEKRSRRWTEKLSYWANLEVSDNEEEEEEEEEATEHEEDEGREEAEMKVQVKWSEEEGWEEGEGDREVMEEDGKNEVEIDEEEIVVGGKVEERLIKAAEIDDEEGGRNDEEEQELEQTGECGVAEQDQERPPGLEEDEEEGVGAAEKMMMDVKFHADEEVRELEQTEKINLTEQDNGERSKMDNLSEYDNKEEDCFKEIIDDEERIVETLNGQNNESLVEGQYKFTDEAEIVAEPPTDARKDLEEELESDKEESDKEESDEEELDEEDSDEAESDEAESDEEESDDEDIADEDVKTYCKDGYLSELFGTLKDFRDASLLTDLTLSAADGRSFHVHAPVLAAVSARVYETLRGRAAEDNGVHLCLGPEVDSIGLEAVVEFAYTGFLSQLNEDTVGQIKAAARSLEASRVTDLCREEEEKPETTGDGQEEVDRVWEEQQTTLQAIKQVWTEKVGCDVILEAIEGSFHVHRVVLAASSDYFRCMFTSGMKESRQPRVTLPSLLASDLEALINCSYSGGLPLSWSCVFEVTSTALQLQHQSALCVCLQFLQREINPRVCLDVASFAEAYALVELLDVSHDYVLRQFQKVASTSKFKDLPAEQLLRYLNSRSLCVPSELIVFRAVVAWIQAKPKKRIGLAKELMKTIQFPLMTYKEFKEVQSLDMWSDHGLEELFVAIFEDFCGSEAPPQSQYRTYLPKEGLVVIGGDQTIGDLGSRRICRDLWFANSIRNHTGIKKATEWRRLAEMPDQGRFCHEVAVLKGQLYVLGGKKYYGTNDTLNSIYRYDPLQNSWEVIPGMQEKRCSFSVVVLDGKIYAIGGHCDPDNSESVEQYCPLANTWSYTSPLDLPLSAHAANILHGQIFVSGGLNSEFRCLASMFVYHPQTGSTYLANMATPRAQHCMEVLGGRLYVAGGITTDESAATLDLLACEMYDPVADRWTEFPSLQVPHVGAGSAVLEGKLYVLGGYSQEDYCDTLMVHRYDPAAQRWENTGRTAGPNNDIRACVLRLPPHLRV